MERTASWHCCVGLLSNDPKIDAFGLHDQGQMSNSGSTTGSLPECSRDMPKSHTLPGLYVVHDNAYPHEFFTQHGDEKGSGGLTSLTHR